jgi:hypothetical protein
VYQLHDHPIGENATWSYNWTGTIRNHIARIYPKPDFLVINAGLWQHDLNGRLLTEINEAIQEVGIAGIYKTTTKKRGQRSTVPEANDVTGCQLFQHCFKTFRGLRQLAAKQNIGTGYTLQPL